MRVQILEAIERKGTRADNSGDYHFTSIKVFSPSTDQEGWFTVEPNVCPPEKIKKGAFAEMRFSFGNSKKIVKFDIVGDKASNQEQPPLPEVPDYVPFDEPPIDTTIGDSKNNNKK